MLGGGSRCRIRAAGGFPSARHAASGVVVLVAVAAASTAPAKEMTLRLRDAACLYQHSDQYMAECLFEEAGVMLIVPHRCPETMCNALAHGEQAWAPDIRTSPDDGGEPRTDEIIALDGPELACFREHFEAQYPGTTTDEGGSEEESEEGSSEESEEEELFVFNTDDCLPQR